MTALRHLKFKDFITLQRGFDLPRADMVDGPYPVVGSTSIIGYHDQFKVTSPGVVTGRSGSLGQIQYVRENYWPHNTSLWVKDFKGNLPLYVYYFLHTIDLARFNAGAGVPTLNRNHLDQLEIAVHVYADQCRIASILSAYDDLIENNTRRIKLLEQMAQAIYREWFVEFRAPGVKLRKATSEEQKVTGKDRFPVGWEIKPLDDVVEEIIDYRGKTPKKLGSEWSDSGVMAVSALNVKQGRLVNLEKSKFVDEGLYRKWMKSELRQGDILMTSEAPLGELYYLSDKKRLCLSQRLFSIRADATLLAPVLLYMGLSSPTTQKEIHGRSSGTTVLGIRQAELRKVPVLLPAKIVQDKVSPVLDNFLAAIEMLQAKNANLRQTRDLLLPRLVGGEIRIEPSADEGTD